MNTLTLSQIDAAVDAAFQTALSQSPAQRVAPQQIADNTTLRTDVYVGPKGSGFAVVAQIKMGDRIITRIRQNGPETQRERPWPSMTSLLEECKKARASCYDAEASVYDLADAETKLASPDPALQAEGAIQKSAVLSKRLEIKAEIPKPQ